jgi:hypothetical protein
MKVNLLLLLFFFNASGQEIITPVRVLTDGFNCKEGIIVADQIRELVGSDSILQAYTQEDSSYIIVEITSFNDGGTAVINAGFATVTPLQRNDLDYKFTRRLVSKTLVDMKEISLNIVEKIHLIRKS